MRFMNKKRAGRGDTRKVDDGEVTNYQIKPPVMAPIGLVPGNLFIQRQRNSKNRADHLPHTSSTLKKDCEFEGFILNQTHNIPLAQSITARRKPRQSKQRLRGGSESLVRRFIAIYEPDKRFRMKAF